MVSIGNINGMLPVVYQLSYGRAEGELYKKSVWRPYAAKAFFGTLMPGIAASKGPTRD
jgi:hypothetical protein